MQTILNSYQSLKAARAPWESWWEALRHYVLPDRQHTETGYDTAEAPATHHLSDTTAVEACQKLASGHLSYMTPSNEMWFKWSCPLTDAGDEAESWYNRCSEIANRELAQSNFYTELHECFLDRVGLGTGCLYCGTTRSGRLLKMMKASWIPTCANSLSLRTRPPPNLEPGRWGHGGAPCWRIPATSMRAACASCM